MPLTPSRTRPTPHAGLAWVATVAMLTLEKLKCGEDVSDEERTSLFELSRELSLLSQASMINAEDLLAAQARSVPRSLRSSFSTLVALEEAAEYAPSHDFTNAGKDLSEIEDQLKAHGSHGVDSLLIERGQAVCLNLLEHLHC
jgi:hypothetical protein